MSPPIDERTAAALSLPGGTPVGAVIVLKSYWHFRKPENNAGAN